MSTAASPVPEHWSIVVMDIVGSGRWDDRTQLCARTALERIVRAAVRSAGIPWRKLAVEDRGDGMILFVPASTSKADLIDPLIPRLAAILGEYNRVICAASRIRLRVAVHAGEVLRSPSGWVGTDINLACRLVNSEPLYRELTRVPRADVVLVVSDVIHQGVIRHGYRGITPSGYRAVHVVSKEVDTHAWVHIPGVLAPARRRSVGGLRMLLAWR
ncbi:hypothetical protein ALI144C_31555 [Actinosynnema sp. ALI-1.44]|nr:hypothetical protein ALI144C_31555 [Actinosynnema sp. ALI-1.44]